MKSKKIKKIRLLINSIYSPQVGSKKYTENRGYI